jgi:hypothetical protein
MLHLDIRVRQRYYELKIATEDAYQIFDHNPSAANNLYYKEALQNFQDFCVAYVAYLVGDEEYGQKNPCEE